MKAIPLAQVGAYLAAEQRCERALCTATGRAGGEMRLSVNAPNLATSCIPRSEHS